MFLCCFGFWQTNMTNRDQGMYHGRSQRPEKIAAATRCTKPNHALPYINRPNDQARLYVCRKHKQFFKDTVEHPGLQATLRHDLQFIFPHQHLSSSITCLGEWRSCCHWESSSCVTWVKVSTRVLDTSERQSRFEDWILHLSTFEIELVFQMTCFGNFTKALAGWDSSPWRAYCSGMYGNGSLRPLANLDPQQAGARVKDMHAGSNKSSELCRYKVGDALDATDKQKKHGCNLGQLLAAKVDNGEANFFFETLEKGQRKSTGQEILMRFRAALLARAVELGFPKKYRSTEGPHGSFCKCQQFSKSTLLKHLLAEPHKMEDAVKHPNSINQLTCFLSCRLGSSWFGCKLHAAGLGLGSISQALFVWSLNHDVDFVRFCDVDGRLTRREFVCAVVLQKLATPPEAGMEDVIIWAEPFYSLTRHLYFLKCYAMVNLVQDSEHKMRKANSWVLTGFFTRLRVPFLERQSKVSASPCLCMVFGILTLNVCPKLSLFDQYQPVLSRPVWPLSPLGHGSCTKLMVARASWATFTWLHWGESRCHEVKPARVFCSCGFTWFHLFVLMATWQLWHAVHARWLYLIAARAEDLPMPEGFCGLLPNTWHARPCMHFYLYACWYVYVHLFIRLPTHLCDYSPTYLRPIHLLPICSGASLFSTYPFIHAWSEPQIWARLKNTASGKQDQKDPEDQKDPDKGQEKDGGGTLAQHDSMFRSLFLAVNNTAIPGVRRLRRVWTETPAAARLL